MEPNLRFPAVFCENLRFPTASCALQPKGPFRTKNTTAIAKIVNYYAVVFLLRPPNLLRPEPFLERENVCDFQENGARTRRAAIVNRSAVVNSLRVLFLVRRGPLGNAGISRKDESAKICGFLRRSAFWVLSLAHPNRTIAIAGFRVDGARSPEIPQKEGVSGSEIAARNRRSLATFDGTLKSQCGIAFSCLANR